MIDGRRVAVVMPAYNAEKTLEQTVHELPKRLMSRSWWTMPARTIRFA